MKIKFYSHTDENKKPVKELKEHLRNVGEKAKKHIENIPIKSKEILKDIAYLIGISHDFGKYTSYFQNYLLEGEDNPLSHHSFLSSVFSAWIVKKYLYEKQEKNYIYKYLPLISYFVVLHHHGDLASIEDDVPLRNDLQNPPDFNNANNNIRTKLRNICKQIKDLDKNKEAIKNEYNELIKNISTINDIKIESFYNDFLEIFKHLDFLKYNFLNKLEEKDKIYITILTLLLYSVLIDSDKKDAGEVNEIKRKKLPIDLVDRYKLNNFKNNDSELNKIRNEIYNKVIEKIKKVELKNHIFTLTAPTGTGKTLTSFSAALNLREKIKNEKGYIPRIIYSLPFVTIIEQNYSRIRDVLSLIEDFEQSESSYLIKHHHLTDIEYKESDDRKNIEESLLLIESWESEIIVTTFVQLLHTIIGFKNSFLKKYHNLAGSIILLDEVQNIPVEYWELIRKVIIAMAKLLGCYFIFMTATKPLIFKENEAVELLENKEKYFKKLNRVKLVSKISESKTIEEFINWFTKNYNKNKSYLIVVNTIKASKEIYNKIQEKRLLNNENLFYLSTSIIPKQREEIIFKIAEKIKNNEKIITVSTQVIEAGVDLDFDIAIRDIGPIDSIIQVAGRCNREGKNKKNKVYVVLLKDENTSRTYASYIYGVIHPDLTKKILNNKTCILEHKFIDLIDEYFNNIKNKINDDISKYIWEALSKLFFYSKNPPERNGKKIQVSEFQLIDEKGEYIEVFVELDCKAKKVWKEYINNVCNEKDFKKKKINYLKIRKDFKSYIISVRRTKNLIIPVIECGFGYINNNQLNDFYSLKTGLKTDLDILVF